MTVAIAEGPPAELAERLVLENRGLVRLFARRAASRHGLEEDDVAQRMFARVARKARYFDPGRAKATTFVGQLCQNVAWDLSRERSRREAALCGRAVVPLGEAFPAGGGGPAAREAGEAADRAEAVRLLRAAVAALSAADRRVLVRCYGLDGRPPATFTELGRGNAARGRRWVGEAVERVQGLLFGG